MLKKSFSLLIALFLVFFTSSVFAANDEIGNSMNKARDSVRNVVGGAENVVEDAAGALGTGVKDLGNTVANGATNVTHSLTNQDDGYTATRTSTDTNGAFLGMSGNTWTWLVLSVVAIAIVGLVWYYAMQNKNEYHNNNH